MTQWTTKMLADLLRWRAEGLDARAIATRLGNGITRNSVLGQTHRLKIAAGHKPQPRKWQPRPAFDSLPSKQALHRKPIIAPLTAKPVLRCAPLPPAPKGPVRPFVPIHELSEDGCRFAATPHNVRPRDHMFCDEPRREGSSYCAVHHEICQPVNLVRA